MASGKEYLHFILEQLSDLDDISYRPMMGEFILYYRGKIVGGIYDDLIPRIELSRGSKIGHRFFVER
jgi:TfoX/Sxy family transcriptional regulator of competence genes